jgi:hypothetical protein
MDDKTLLQSLINEIKNLNARGVTDSKVLRDSLSQDSLISQGITDLNKKFEKSSKDNKQILDDSKSVLEEIRDEIKNNSGGNQGGGIVQAANLQNLSTLFFKMIDSTKDLIAINTQLNKNIEDLIKSNNGLRSFRINRRQSPTDPTTVNTTQESETTTTSTNESSQPLLKRYNGVAKALGSFIGAINGIKIIPALKASFFLPMIVSNMANAMKKFDEANFFGKLRRNSQTITTDKQEVENVFDYSSDIFTAMKSLAESLKTIQDLKLVKTWAQIKLLSIFIIPSMIKAISKFERINEKTATKFEKIGESIGKFLEPISTFMGSFVKMGLGLIAIAAGVLAIAGAAILVSKIDTTALLKGGIAIGVFLTTAILTSSIAGKANKTSIALIVLGAAMIPFAYGISLLKDIGWEQIAAAGVSLVSLIGTLTIASKFSTKSSIALIAFGAAMIPFAYGLSLLGAVSWQQIAAVGTSLVALISSLTIAGAFLANPKAMLALGLVTAAIAGISWSMKMLGEAANIFNTIDPMNLLKVAGAMLGLSLSILPLVPFAPFVGILSISMAVLAATLMSLSKVGLQLEPVTNFFNDFKSFIKEIEISKILGLSAAIGTLGLAIGAFAASNFSVSISDAFSGIIGFFTKKKSVIEQLKELSTLTNLSVVGNAVKDLAEGMNMLAQIQTGSFVGFNEFPWDKIKEISKELEDGATLQIIPVLNANSLNGQKLETTGATMNGGNNVIINSITNTGGNVSTTNVSNNNRNVRVAPSIETGSAKGY